MNGQINNGSRISGSLSGMQTMSGSVTVPTSSIENDYEKLINLPSINNHTIKGNMTSQELGIDGGKWGEISGDIETQNDLMVELEKRESQAISVTDIEKILYLG